MPDLVGAVIFGFLAAVFAYAARVVLEEVRSPGLFTGPGSRLGMLGLFLACGSVSVACLSAVSVALAK